VVCVKDERLGCFYRTMGVMCVWCVHASWLRLYRHLQINACTHGCLHNPINAMQCRTIRVRTQPIPLLLRREVRRLHHRSVPVLVLWSYTHKKGGGGH
jgi:hypothetical protein